MCNRNQGYCVTGTTGLLCDRNHRAIVWQEPQGYCVTGTTGLLCDSVMLVVLYSFNSAINWRATVYKLSFLAYYAVGAVDFHKSRMPILDHMGGLHLELLRLICISLFLKLWALSPKFHVYSRFLKSTQTIKRSWWVSINSKNVHFLYHSEKLHLKRLRPKINLN